jgi:hypothetical protein
MNHFKPVVGFSLFLTLLTQPFVASVAESIRFKGRSADAFFESRSGCDGTIVNVFSTEQVLGNPSNAGEVFVEVRQFDPCNNDEPSLAASRHSSRSMPI